MRQLSYRIINFAVATPVLCTEVLGPSVARGELLMKCFYTKLKEKRLGINFEQKRCAVKAFTVPR